MQTLLAYAVRADADPERVHAGLDRVERWYRPLTGPEVVRRSQTDERTGLALWSVPDAAGRWPAWSRCGDRAVVSLHVPLGAERLTGPVSAAAAPAVLTRHLAAHPRDVERLTAPFVLVEHAASSGRLLLLTDGLGLGRLFEVRTDEGRFWSNRPVAALLFAGVRAEADPLAWRRMAACDWAMGDAAPYRGVRVVPGGTSITAGPDRHDETGLDVLAGLVAAPAPPLDPAALALTATALTEAATTIAGLQPEVPVLGLSGGRDSRLVAAAFLAAGLPVRLRTLAGATGEVETARALVGRLPAGTAHEVSVPDDQRSGGHAEGALARGRRWHDVTEGLRPARYLSSAAPRRLLHHRPLLVAGVGGEFGHAPGYPDDVERLEDLPLPRRLDAFARGLQAKVVLPRGLSRAALEATTAQLRRVLEHAADRGVQDARMLDWFYADERLRRWGMAGESAGRLLPLLSPEFVRGGFALSTAQSRASALHTALIARLVPAWAGVAYYSATLRQRHGVARQRLWEEPDADLVGALVADPSGWHDAFDVPTVQAVWQDAVTGRAGARDEHLLERVVWRASFDDHLAALNQETPPRRPSVAVRPGSAPTAPDRRVRRLLLRTAQHAALRANDLPLARRLARTALGRYLRRRVGV